MDFWSGGEFGVVSLGARSHSHRYLQLGMVSPWSCGGSCSDHDSVALEKKSIRRVAPAGARSLFFSTPGFHEPLGLLDRSSVWSCLHHYGLANDDSKTMFNFLIDMNANAPCFSRKIGRRVELRIIPKGICF